MSNDWIAMRVDLQTHPKVFRISSALKADKLRTIGGLHAVWCLFDAHSEDGRLTGYTPEVINSIIGMDGFAEAMIDVGWLNVEDSQTVAIPRFEQHNGKSAKRRMMDSERKKDIRNSAKCPQPVPKVSANEADKLRTTEQNRTSIIKEVPKGTKKPSEQFARPTLEEVVQFSKEFIQASGTINTGFSSESFFDYYQGNGWKVGKVSMKDWRATCRRWIRDNSFNSGGDKSSVKTPGITNRQDATPEQKEALKRWHQNSFDENGDLKL